MTYMTDGKRCNAAWSLPNSPDSHPLSIAPGQGNLIQFSITNKLRQVEMEKQTNKTPTNKTNRKNPPNSIFLQIWKYPSHNRSPWQS